MAYDNGAEPQWLEDDEWISIYSMFDPSVGEDVPLYTFNENYTGSKRALHKGDWIRLRKALEATSSGLTRGDMDLALSRLVGALRAAAVTAIYAKVTPSAGHLERCYRYVFAHQWATSAVDVEEDSLNLTDGSLLSDIYLNRKDVHDWLKARSDPDGPIHNDPDYQERCDKRHHEIGGGPRPVSSPSAEKPKSKGGAPETYPWARAHAWLMVNSVFHGKCGGLTDRTPQVEICRLLRIALDAVSPGADPAASVVADHARYIQQVFREADDDLERQAGRSVSAQATAKQVAQRARQ